MSCLFAWMMLVSLVACRHAETTDETPATGTAEARFGLEFEPVQFTPPQVDQTTLGNGITLDCFTEAGMPLATIVVRIGAGSIYDPAGKEGCAEMTAEVIRNGGTATLDGDALDRALEERGAELSAESDRESTWFRLSVLREDLDWGVALLADLLSNPALPEAKLEEARGRSLVGLRQRLDVPSSVARALFPQLIAGQGNPWGTTPREATLMALTRDDLAAYFKKYYQPGTIKLGISGDFTIEEATQLAEQNFGSWAAGEMELPPLPEFPTIEKTQIYIVPREISQNVIYFGHEGVGRFEEDKFPIRIFNSVLSGGFTSRLFREVRSKRGLAYSVYGRLGEDTQRGLFFNVVLTKVESSAEALGLMLDINHDLQTTAPDAEEMALAIQSEVNSFVFFFDTPEKILRQKMTQDALGYPEDYLPTWTQKMAAVEADEVQQAAERHLHLDRLVILIIGQVDDALRSELETLGPITEIDEETLRSQWL